MRSYYIQQVCTPHMASILHACLCPLLLTWLPCTHAMHCCNVPPAELLVAGADAKSGLLPFIMLDGYNHLIAFLQRSIAELEAQLQPHRLLRHRLALLLHKHGIPPPYTRQQQQQGQQPQPQPQPQPQQQQLVGPAVPIKDNQQRQQQQQQQQESPRLAMLRGAQRDAVELEQAATSIKQLRAELARVQHPISASMSHAIVSLVKACREYNAADDDIVPV
jgi:hypothetical protein